MRNLLLLGVLLISSPLAQGQESHSKATVKDGYIILRSNEAQLDHLKLIHYRPAFPFECLQIIGDDTLRYRPEELLGYGFRGLQQWVSRKVSIGGKEEWLFLALHFENEGGIKLLQNQDAGSRGYYLESSSGDLTHLSKENLAASLSELLPPCKGHQEQDFKRVDLRRTAIIRFMKRHQDCLNAADPPSGKWVRRPLNAGLSLSYLQGRATAGLDLSRSTGSSSWLINKPLMPSTSRSAAITLEFPFFRQFTLRTELSRSSLGYFHSLDVGSISLFRREEYQRINELSFSYRTTQIPLSIRYYFPGIRLVPFVEAGYSFQHASEIRGYSRTLDIEILSSSVAPTVAYDRIPLDLTSLVSEWHHAMIFAFGGRFYFTSWLALDLGGRYTYHLIPSALRINQFQFQAALVFVKP